MRVLILENGRSRGALATVRSLGRAGHTVEVAAPIPALAGWSRWCRQTHRLPEATDPHAIDALRALDAARRFDVVIPGGDIEAQVAADDLGNINATVAVAEPDSLKTALDKQKLSETAGTCGMSVPRTLVGLPATMPPAGLIVKEKLHGGALEGARSRQSFATRAMTKEAAETAIARVQRAGGEVLLQEVVTGDLAAYCVVVNRQGRLLAEVQQQALAVSPPGAGVSSRAETVPIDAGLRELSMKLVGELGLWGIVQVQYLIHPSRPPVLIDVNPRIYGSIALAIAAGADLPSMLVKVAAGTTVKPNPPARTGVRYQWLEGDLRRAFGESHHRPREVVRCLAWAPTATHSVASLNDPLPGMRFSLELIRRGVRKVTKRRPL